MSPATIEKQDDEVTLQWLPTTVSTALGRKLPDVPKRRVNALVQVIYGFVDARTKSVEAVINSLVEDIATVLQAEEAAGKSAISQGAGLGKKLSAEEGKRRLANAARVRTLESWAGNVATAGETGIAASTLSAWRKQHVVVGIKRDRRNYVYPLAQFVDGTPVEGIADVLAAARDAKAAWLWLLQPHAVLDGAAPLDALKAGKRDQVALAAKRDFI